MQTNKTAYMTNTLLVKLTYVSITVKPLRREQLGSNIKSSYSVSF